MALLPHCLREIRGRGKKIPLALAAHTTIVTASLEGVEDLLLDYSHNTLFVLASLAIALIAAFSGLSLTQGASQMREPVRKITISAAAVILGWGIWSMHFVAMLGLTLPIAYFFDPLITLMSAFIAILFMGLALLILHYGERSSARIAIAGLVVGVGIPVMHYTGVR